MHSYDELVELNGQIRRELAALLYRTHQHTRRAVDNAYHATRFSRAAAERNEKEVLALWSQVQDDRGQIGPGGARPQTKAA